LASYAGKLQADGYAGYEPLFEAPSPAAPARVIAIGCWGHARRKWFDLWEAKKSPIAFEALERIGKLYDIEDEIRGRSAETRRAVRQDKAVPLLNDLRAWMIDIAARADRKSVLVEAVNYSLNRWTALLRYTDDGRLEMDNLAAERSLRGVGLGRKNYLFFGADSGGERAAIIYTLIETCKLNHIDPQRYLEYVLERIGDHPINRIEELFPWNVIAQLGQPEEVTQALAA
jgi:hypothetical protein